jgi:low affinity Fe/Cu permease
METVEAYIGLLIQVPLVGIFVWFALQLIHKFLSSIESVTKSFTVAIEAMTSTFVQSADNRDGAWRDFMNQQREANNASIANMAARFSDEIRVLGKEVAELKNQVRQ